MVKATDSPLIQFVVRMLDMSVSVSVSVCVCVCVSKMTSYASKQG